MLNYLWSKIFPRTRSISQSAVDGRARAHIALTLQELQKRVENGDFRLAQELFETAPNLPQDNPYVKFVAGLIAVDKGNLADARTLFESVRQTSPLTPGVNFALGNIASSEGNYRQALEQYADELTHYPEQGLTWLNFGVAHFKMRDLPKAKKALMKASDLLENKFVAQIKLSNIFFVEKDYGRAEEILLKLEGYEHDLEAAELLICICIDKKEFDRALNFIVLFENSGGEEAQAQGYRGFVCQARGEHKEALLHYRHAVATDPGNCTNIYNLGNLLRDMGRFAEARACFLDILQIDNNHSGAKWGLSLCMLLAGEYASGWENYEMRVHSDEHLPRDFPLPRWHGEKKGFPNILVTAEQGLGDEIMFSSCVPDLIAQKNRVLLECNPKLAPIFARSFGGVKVIGRAQTLNNDWIKDYPDVEHVIPVGSLPLLFRKDLKFFPPHKGYLKADLTKIAYWRQRLASLGERPKVGISWRGGLVRTKSKIRSIPLKLWHPILELPFDFVSLQYTDCTEEIDSINQLDGIQVHSWPEAIVEYDETAALVTALDMVVSVQTSVVHLAGALGAPVIALISAAPEWRYRVQGDSMPWYPSVKLIRQKELFNWQEVIIDVREAIIGDLAGR